MGKVKKYSAGTKKGKGRKKKEKSDMVDKDEEKSEEGKEMTIRKLKLLFTKKKKSLKQQIEELKLQRQI
jgi:hypothetical protein